MSCKEIFWLRNSTDRCYDTVKLFLSTIFAVTLGVNLKIVLDVFYKIISNTIGTNQIVMLAGTIVIAVFIEFIIDTLPEYIVDSVINKINEDKTFKIIGILRHNCSLTVLLFIKIVNYIFIGLLLSFMFLSIFTYKEDNDLFCSEFVTYKISNYITNQIIDSDYMQYFIRKNEVYNGVNMSKAMEIDSDIKREAELIVEGYKADLDKVRLLYNWVGTNIMYDNELAKDIDSKKIENTFGARYAFYNRSGVCFEFATLFGAMADSVGIKTRVIVGRAFNGIEFGPHAWNEVYIKDEDRWISIDPTFWGHKDSFDSSDFDAIHEKEKIAWESGIK